METLIAYPQNKAQETALKAIFKALDVPFDKKNNESPYNLEFVKKIEESRKEIIAGKGKRIKVEDLWK